MQITRTTVEYQENPLGLDVAAPRFSWKLEQSGCGKRQSAYRICVHKENQEEVPVWDTGKVYSDASIQIPYSGEPLESCTKYIYRVMVWDQDDVATDWSEEGSFETAFLQNCLWQASWICPEGNAPGQSVCPAFRKLFAVSREVKKARLYISGKGIYEAYINGEKVGEDYFAPGWTSYHKRIQYQTYDITRFLQNGDNALGVWMGNGWYKGEIGWNGRRDIYGDRLELIAQLHIQFADGTEQIIKTDDTWESRWDTEIAYAEFYHGEKYDARKCCGASDPHGKNEGWNGVQVRSSSAKKILRAQEGAAVRVKQVRKPIALIKTPRGETVLDMGQNMTGWVQFKVQGNPGDRVVLTHAEILDNDGNFYVDNLRGAQQRIEYTLKGGETEVYRPHFTFHGFRYICVEEYPGEISLENFEGQVLYSDLETTGNFSCSNPLVNQLFSNLTWSQRCNFVDVPTDCPQRNERLGWTGDIQIFSATAARNMNVAPFLTKWLHDLSADQFESGGVPWIVPDMLDTVDHYGLYGYFGQSEPSSAAWGDAAVICPWEMYLAYGDVRILKEQYRSMKGYIDYIKSQGDDPYTWDTGYQFGDWVALDAPYGSFIGATDPALVATAYYAYSVGLLSKIAAIIGDDAEAELYKQMHRKITERFCERYVNDQGEVTEHTQTALAVALKFGLLPLEYRYQVCKKLADWLERTDYNLTTGFVGTPYICHALSENGFAEVAYQLLLKEDYPSWLYQVTKGATTIWEHLDGLKPDGTMWDVTMNSFNHYAYGSVGEWMYKAVAGICIDETKPAYKHTVFRPIVTKRLEFAQASVESLYGTVALKWEHTERSVRYTVDVPVNTTAEVHVKMDGGYEILVGEAFDAKKGQDGNLSVVLGSGHYEMIVY